jgi:hypothetical protein
VRAFPRKRWFSSSALRVEGICLCNDPTWLCRMRKNRHKILPPLCSFRSFRGRQRTEVPPPCQSQFRAGEVH